MPIDEKTLGDSIFSNSHYLLPLAMLFLTALVIPGNQIIGAAIAGILALLYHQSGWDGRILLWYGIAALALSAAGIGATNASFSNGIAFSGYWMLFSGSACLAAGLWGKKAPGRRVGG